MNMTQTQRDQLEKADYSNHYDTYLRGSEKLSLIYTIVMSTILLILLVAAVNIII